MSRAVISVARSHLRLGDQRDVPFDACDERALQRLGVAQLSERTDAVGVPVEDVDVGHGGVYIIWAGCVEVRAL